MQHAMFRSENVVEDSGGPSGITHAFVRDCSKHYG